MCGGGGCTGGEGPFLKEERAETRGETGGRNGQPSASSARSSRATLGPTDPFADPDPVWEVEFALVELASQMDAAMLRFLEGLRQFDTMQGYLLGGFRSTAHWLVGRCGVTLATARERVRVARALEAMPLTAEALGEGRISYSIARALTRLGARGTRKDSASMEPEEEAALLEAASERTAGAVEAMVRAWAMKTPEDETERELSRMAARTLSLRPRHDGMWEVRGLLTPEIGAAVLAAVEGAMDWIFREGEPGAAYATGDLRKHPRVTVNGVPLAEWEAEGKTLPLQVQEMLEGQNSAAAARRRRADALGLVCQWALAGGGLGGATRSDAGPAATPAVSAVRTSGLRATTTQVVLHVDLAVLRKVNKRASPGRPDDPSHLTGSVRVSAETSRRLSCDATVVPLVVRKGLGEARLDALESMADGVMGSDAGVEAPAPEIVGLGAATRTVNPSLRRALDARDGGCRFPGCEGRFTEAHHVVHWSEGGETSIRNLILLCHHHHTLLHEGGWRMAWPPGQQGRGTPLFFDPRGGVHNEGRLRRPRVDPQGMRRKIQGTDTGRRTGSHPLGREGRIDAA